MKLPVKVPVSAISFFLGTIAIAHAQSSVAVYGILDASVSYAKSEKSKSALRSGDLAAPRLGFKGREDLGSGLSVNFALEAGLSNDVGSGSANNTNNQSSGAISAGPLTFNRQSWVGLEGNWGELRLGRNFNPTYRQYIAYDPFNGGGIGTSQAAQSSLATYGYSPAGLRHSNAVEYWLPAKGALSGQFMYAMGENSSGAQNSSDGNYLSGRLAYKFSNAEIGIAAGQMKNNSKKDINEYVLGGRYRIDNLVLMGMYTRTSEGIGTGQNGWLLGGTMHHKAMEYRVSLSGSKTKSTNGVLIGKSEKLAALARYHLSKRSSIYLMGVHIINSNGAAMAPHGTLAASETIPNKNASALSIGMTHTF